MLEGQVLGPGGADCAQPRVRESHKVVGAPCCGSHEETVARQSPALEGTAGKRPGETPVLVWRRKDRALSGRDVWDLVMFSTGQA